MAKVNLDLEDTLRACIFQYKKIKKGPKRSKHLSNTDSGSSESNSNIHKQFSEHNSMGTQILPTPAKNIRHNTSKKISKISDNNGLRQPIESLPQAKLYKTQTQTQPIKPQLLNNQYLEDQVNL